MTQLFSLRGRSALITGGSRGIGRMIAEGFLAQGADVYITARKAEACDQAAAEMSALGRCVSLPGDVSSAAGIADVVSRLSEHVQSLDVLVNNAGAAWGAPFDDFPEAGWDKVMDVNVKGLFFLTQALKPALQAASTDHLAKVINIASIDGVSVNTWYETYSYHASKAAVIHLTKRMAHRLAQDGIIVSGIAPGAFATEMNHDAVEAGDDLIDMIPAGRVGTPEDIAAAAVYLASSAGDYVVGHTLPVDGGVIIAR